jgi:MbtH protein
MAVAVPNHGGQPRYRVVVNDEEQYSIWRLDMTVPPGWRGVGVEGTEEDCLAHIAEVWTDMRPASLRRAMAQDRSTVT